MLHPHGGALVMAPSGLAKGPKATVLHFARGLIVAQRGEILALGRRLILEGRSKPDSHPYDALFAL